MGTFAQYTSFEIRADESKAIAAFDHMKTNYRNALAQMGARVAEFSRIATAAYQETAKEAVAAVARKKAAMTSFKEKGGAVFSEVSRYGTRAFLAIRSAGVSALSHLTKYSVKFAADFQLEMAKVSTLVDEEFLPQLDVARDRLVQMSQRGSQGLLDLTKSFYQTISAGITEIPRALEVIGAAQTAATAGVTKTSVAVDALTTAMNVWGRESGNADIIASQMFMTVRLAKTDFESLSKSLGNAAGVAGLAGIKTYELFGAFSALTKSGLSSRVSMTYMKNLLIKLIEPAKQAKEVWKELGLEWGQAALQSKGLGGIIEEIRQKTGGAADKIWKLTGNIRAYHALAVLVSGGNKDFLNDMEKIKGSVMDHEIAWARVSNTLKTQWNAALNKSRAIMADMWREAMPTLMDWLRGINEWFKENRHSISEWAKDFSTAMVDAAKSVAGVIMSLRDAFRWLTSFPPAFLALRGISAVNKALFRDYGQEFADAMSQRARAAKEDIRIQQQHLAIMIWVYKQKLPAMAHFEAKLAKIRKQETISHLTDEELKERALIEKAKRMAAAQTRLGERGGKGVGKPPDLDKRKEPTALRLADSVRVYEQARSAVMGLERAEGDALDKLEEKRGQYLLKYGMHADFKVRIDRWYQGEKQKLEQQEEKCLDEIIKKGVTKHLEARRKVFTASQQEASEQRRLMGMRFGLEQAKSPVTEQRKLEVEAVEKVFAVEQQIAALRFSQQEMATRLQAGLVPRAEAETQIATLTRTIELRREEIRLVQETSRVQIEGLTVAGRLSRKFAEDAVNSQAKLADTLYSMYGTMVNNVGSIISSVFEAVVSGQGDAAAQAGKQFIDSIAGMMAMMGSYLLYTGLGTTFVPPYTGAPAAIAGGILLGLAGAAKGVSSLIGGGAKSAASHTGGGEGVKGKIREGLPGTDYSQSSAPVQYHFHVDQGEPWNKRSVQDRYRDWNRWTDGQARATGIPSPKQMIRSMDAKRFR